MTTTATPTHERTRATVGSVVYRFEGQLGAMNPIGLFDQGIRFHNQFEGAVVDGPLAGGRIYGLDEFLLRPDGIGEIHAPEVIEHGDHRVALDVRGYVVPPEGLVVPALEAFLDPSFELPDVPFRVTGSAFAATTSPELQHLNSTTIVIEGEVNLATGRLDVEARAIDRRVS